MCYNFNFGVLLKALESTTGLWNGMLTWFTIQFGTFNLSGNQQRGSMLNGDAADITSKIKKAQISRPDMFGHKMICLNFWGYKILTVRFQNLLITDKSVLILEVYFMDMTTQDQIRHTVMNLYPNIGVALAHVDFLVLHLAYNYKNNL
ncbi:hypothetical protein ACJX0J_026065, partial [Zea mays]